MNIYSVYNTKIFKISIFFVLVKILKFYLYDNIIILHHNINNMENIFSNINRTNFYDKPTHIVKGSINGNFTLNVQEHDKFVNQFVKNKLDNKKKNYDMVSYSSISNTWSYYKI